MVKVLFAPSAVDVYFMYWVNALSPTQHTTGCWTGHRSFSSSRPQHLNIGLKETTQQQNRTGVICHSTVASSGTLHYTAW